MTGWKFIFQFIVALFVFNIRALNINISRSNAYLQNVSTLFHSVDTAISRRFNLHRALEKPLIFIDGRMRSKTGSVVYHDFNPLDTEEDIYDRIAFRNISTSCLFWKRKESYFCPLSVSNVTEWKQDRQVFNQTRGRALQTMCSKPIAIDLLPWKGPKKTNPDEFSISVYSGDNILFSRALACRYTWMQRFPNTSFLMTAKGNPVIPAIAMAKLYPKWFPADVNPVNMMQLLAYREQLKRHPHARWFYTIGDDTYIHADYMLEFLDDLTPKNQTVLEATSKPRWISFCEIPVKISPGVDTSRYENTWIPMYKKNREFVWCSGAVGWFLSRPAAQMFDDELEIFLENLYANATDQDWRRRHAPDVISYMLLTLLGVEPERPPNTEKWSRMFQVSAVDGPDDHPADLGRPHYHYMGPTRMVTLDQRATHEKIDKIVNSGRVDWLVEYFRQFVDEHYDVLRATMTDVRYVYDYHKSIDQQGWNGVPSATEFLDEKHAPIVESSEKDVKS
jgi:hypothetical protein